ncbi:hypothetical protein LX12_004374, partial [Williamsia serinedens]|nr:hypothetical protein [Williamsia serinedens]
MTTPVVAYTGSNIDDFALWAREIRATRLSRIAKPPRIELYDGNWNYRGLCANIMADGSSV